MKQTTTNKSGQPTDTQDDQEFISEEIQYAVDVNHKKAPDEDDVTSTIHLCAFKLFHDLSLHCTMDDIPKNMEKFITCPHSKAWQRKQHCCI